MGIGLIVGRPDLRRGVPIAHLLHGGLFLPVGKEQSVGAEGVVGLPVAEVPAVAQHPASVPIGTPKGLIHIVPEEAALVLGEHFPQADVAFQPAQGVAHAVHIFAQKKRLCGGVLQVFPNGPGRGVHPALHIGNAVKLPAVKHPFIVDQAAGIVFAEKLRHSQNVLPGVGLIAAGPKENGHMIFVPFKHGPGPVHHAVPPLRQASRHVPAGVCLP